MATGVPAPAAKLYIYGRWRKHACDRALAVSVGLLGGQHACVHWCFDDAAEGL
jgi:hypothetical protein